MIIKQASDLHFTYVRNTPELREAFINKCKEFGILVWGDDDKIGSYLEVFACEFDFDDKFEIVFTDNLEFQSKELFIGDLIGVPTETPEEKEVLDGIESAGEVEWNGEGFPPIGVIYTTEPHFEIELLCKYSSEYVVVGEMLPKETYKGMEVVIDTMDQRDRTFRKPETPKQREDRERLEAGYELYKTCGIQHETVSFNEWVDDYKDVWLNIVDKTNYRKEKTHGTN